MRPTRAKLAGMQPPRLSAPQGALHRARRGAAALACAFVTLLACLPAHAHDTLVLSTRAGAPYDEMAASAVRHLAAAQFNGTRAILDQPGWQDLARRNELLVGVGTRADAALRAAQPRAAVVGCGVLRPLAGPAVRLEHSHVARVRLVRQVLPGARVLGLLSGTDARHADLDAFRRAAADVGLQLLVRRVAPGASVDEALAGLADQVDALSVTLDLDIGNPEASRRVMLYSYQNRIPVFGLTEAWARAGALAALEWDWPDMGQQCADLALRVARSPQPVAEMQFPRASPYVLSRRAADYFRVTLSAELVRGARRVLD